MIFEEFILLEFMPLLQDFILNSDFHRLTSRLHKIHCHKCVVSWILMCCVINVSALCHGCKCTMSWILMCCVVGVSMLCHRCKCAVSWILVCCVMDASMLCHGCEWAAIDENVLP